SWKPDSRQMADRARATVTPDDVACQKSVLAFARTHLDVNEVRILLQVNDLDAAPHFNAQFIGSFRQQTLGIRLQNEDPPRRFTSNAPRVDRDTAKMKSARDGSEARRRILTKPFQQASMIE